jgi:hypothetical protein
VNQQLDLLPDVDTDRRPMARHADPVTSHQAAAKVQPQASAGRLLVLRTLAFAGPLNDFELATSTGWQQTSIGKRRLECQRRGWVDAHIRDGEQVTRKSPSGSPSLVWKITNEGRLQLAAA